MTYNPDGAPHRGGRSREEWDAHRRNQALAVLLGEMRSPSITDRQRGSRARALLSKAFRHLSALEIAECEAIIRAQPGGGNGAAGMPADGPAVSRPELDHGKVL